MSTIAAISTPNAAGGISVIRISGENAFKIAAKVFAPINKKIDEMQGYTCAYGSIFSDEGVLDDGVLTVYRAPHSYTGENVAEISCHGGIFISNRILRAIYDAGAVPAEAGEFTKRAFLNGKVSLTQAEAVMDLISSQGLQAEKCALAMREGATFRRITADSDRLVSLLGSLSAWVDYPDEDIPEVETETMLATLSDVMKDLTEISATYDSGKIMREGVSCAIIGKPNVGKSTLMNLLTGCERSIVTDVAGTTRDIIEESVRLGDVLLKLSDTAGIRETDDEIESVGVRLACRRLDESELVLAVFDNSRELDHDDFYIAERVAGRRCVAVVNKSDNVSLLDLSFIKDNFKNYVMISAKSGQGMDELSKAIMAEFKAADIDPSAGVIANERQKKCTDRAVEALGAALSALSFGETLDAVTVLIDEAVSALLELTGEKVSDSVVNNVFSHFCVGK